MTEIEKDILHGRSSWDITEIRKDFIEFIKPTFLAMTSDGTLQGVIQNGIRCRERFLNSSILGIPATLYDYCVPHNCSEYAPLVSGDWEGRDWVVDIENFEAPTCIVRNISHLISVIYLCDHTTSDFWEEN